VGSSFKEESREVGENASLGWDVGDAAEFGLDQSRFLEIIKQIEAFPQRDFGALLIARNGKLVFEEYFNGCGPNELTDIRSAGKSVTSTLVGIAIDKGLITSVGAEVLPFFEKYVPHDNVDEQKRRITVGDLLTMRSGLDADDWDRSSPGEEDNMTRTSDWIEHSLNLPMRHTPGTEWVYSAASPMLLAGVIESVVRGDVFDFAQQHLFRPLGITHLRWSRTPKNLIVGQGNLWLTARDALKFGQLFLAGGTWKGRRIVSEAWVHRATEMHVDFSEFEVCDHRSITARELGVGYGYLWWHGAYEVGGRTVETFLASGNGGNHIQVVPALDLVVVLIGMAYNTSYGNPRSFDLLSKVLGAVDR
jgi:CubicO group peptidase (beta-lactamase class C family)